MRDEEETFAWPEDENVVVCWSCGSDHLEMRAEPIEVGDTKPRGYYECQTCGQVQ